MTKKQILETKGQEELNRSSRKGAFLEAGPK